MLSWLLRECMDENASYLVMKEKDGYVICILFSFFQMSCCYWISHCGHIMRFNSIGNACSSDNLRLLKVADSSISDGAAPAIKPEICDGISLICQRIVRRMGFARDPESRALRRRLLMRSALLLSRPQLPPPSSDPPHHKSSNAISRIVRSCPCFIFFSPSFLLLARHRVPSVAMSSMRAAGRPFVSSRSPARGCAFTMFRWVDNRLSVPSLSSAPPSSPSLQWLQLHAAPPLKFNRRRVKLHRRCHRAPLIHQVDVCETCVVLAEPSICNAMQGRA